MPDQTIEIIETFTSIQGESSYAGFPCFFIRLAGCNLRCGYCDTKFAYGPGKIVAVDGLVEECAAADTPISEVTGGEPLLHASFPALASLLRDRTRKPVLVETNGSLDISVVPEGIIAIVDVKCPASGMSGSMDMNNMRRLRPQDEVKFVVKDRKDYDWARGIMKEFNLISKCHVVLFSPVFGELDPSVLGQWMASDRLPARLQIQLHKAAGLR